LNGDGKFAVFYVSVISVALVSSLYANTLNPWKHAVFTFPSETQKVVENGTAVMDIKWRWLPETLEIIVKVNDDETNATPHADRVHIIFDSDNNGKLTTGWGNYNLYDFDDHGVFLLSKAEDPWLHSSAYVTRHCWVDSDGHVSGPLVWDEPYFVFAYIDNTTTCTFEDGKGYTFNTSIPIKYINVKSPTQVIINYLDGDYNFIHISPGEYEVDEAFLVAKLEM
jgi:hypothetical protein